MAQASEKRGVRLVRQSTIENRQSKISCTHLTVMDINPEALEKALMNKPGDVAQAPPLPLRGLADTAKRYLSA